MGRLSGIGIGDRVRLYGARFATGALDGVLLDEKDGIYRMRLDDASAPVGLLYDTVGSVHAVVWGVIHPLTSVERLEVAA